VKNQLH